MTADALAGAPLIAMALLRPGWEKNYYSRPAIEPVVCVGRIVSHERQADGKYNFLLEGWQRARIEREHDHEPANSASRPYRVARLVPLPETAVMEIDLGEERERLERVFAAGPLSRIALGRQFRKMLSSPLPTADIADLIAFNMIEDVLLKQSLLAEGDVRLRVGRVLAALHAMTTPDAPGMWAAMSVEALGAGDPNLN